MNLKGESIDDWIPFVRNNAREYYQIKEQNKYLENLGKVVLKRFGAPLSSPVPPQALKIKKDLGLESYVWDVGIRPIRHIGVITVH